MPSSSCADEASGPQIPKRVPRAGEDVRRVTSWFEVEVPALDFVLHDPATVLAAVQVAGLTDVEWYLRGPH